MVRGDVLFSPIVELLGCVRLELHGGWRVLGGGERIAIVLCCVVVASV